MAGGGGNCGAPAFQTGDALLQDGDGRVVQPRIDVAEIVQVEERCSVLDVLEDVGGGLVDRRRTRPGRRVGGRAGMDRQRLEPVAAVVRRRAAAGRGFAGAGGGGRGGRFRMMPLLTPLHDNSPPRRPNSIFGQRFMTTSMPAASAGRRPRRCGCRAASRRPGRRSRSRPRRSPALPPPA